MRRWQRKWVDSLVAVGLLAVVSGATALFLPGADVVLHTLGAAVFGAGLSVLISALTGKRAAYEQYAKDANLRRRDAIYNPLYAELCYIRNMLEQGALFRPSPSD